MLAYLVFMYPNNPNPPNESLQWFVFVCLCALAVLGVLSLTLDALRGRPRRKRRNPYWTSPMPTDKEAQAIINNASPPNGKPCTTTTEGLTKACRAFAEENGDEFQKALERLRY